MPEMEAEALKNAVKEALDEALTERRTFLRQIIAEAMDQAELATLVREVIEDMAMERAIKEGQDSPVVSRAEVFDALKDKAA